MIKTAQLDLQIYNYVKEMEDMVLVQGKLLTDPEVLRKSMELDVLIITAMRSKKRSFRQSEAC
jgi:hypothetical protein